MDERRLGPVVGLGTWQTFDDDSALAREVASAALDHEREIVRHPGAVAIIAVDRDGQVTLVRQLREPARRRLLELPAGTREPDEEPLATAKRELESMLPQIEDAKTLAGLLLYLRER